MLGFIEFVYSQLWRHKLQQLKINIEIIYFSLNGFFFKLKINVKKMLTLFSVIILKLCTNIMVVVGDLPKYSLKIWSIVINLFVKHICCSLQPPETLVLGILQPPFLVVYNRQKLLAILFRRLQPDSCLRQSLRCKRKNK